MESPAQAPWQSRPAHAPHPPLLCQSCCAKIRTENARERVQVVHSHGLSVREHERARSIIDRAGVGCRDRAVRNKSRAQRCQLFALQPAELLVFPNDHLALAVLDYNGNDLCIKRTAFPSTRSAIVRLDRKRILICARALVLSRSTLDTHTHRLVFRRVSQPISKDRICRACVAKCKPPALEIVRCITHALHAARQHYAAVAEPQALHRKRDGLHAACTHLVDSRSLCRYRTSGTQHNLASWRLAHAALQHAPQERLLNVGWRQPRTLDRSPGRRNAKIHSTLALERSLERTDRRARGRYNVHVWHVAGVQPQWRERAH